jgi:DNA polymerase I
MEAEKRAEEAGFKVLYMDTDSLFLLLGDKKKEDALEFLKKFNSSLPGKMELELEDFYTRGVFVGKKTGEEKGAKKKYALLGEDGKVKIRGFELVRRDWSSVARETQRKVLEAILKDGSKEKAIGIVKEVVARLREGKVPLEEVVIYTQLKKSPGNYDIVSPELSAAKKGIERGKKIGQGSVVGYVITTKGKSISDRAELIEFAKDYDPSYYIDNQVLPSVMKILKELGFDEYELKHGGKQKGLSDFF